MITQLQYGVLFLISAFQCMFDIIFQSGSSLVELSVNHTVDG